MSKTTSSLSSLLSMHIRHNHMKDFSHRLIAENLFTVNDLILPIFLTEGSKIKDEVPKMQGVYRNLIDFAKTIVKELMNK
jgi:porphobilinogen synthase